MKMAILAAGQGSRLRTETGGRPKLLADVAGRSLLDRQLDVACRIGAEPLVVTRPELAEDFRRTGMEVLVEDEPAGILGTLYHARGALEETFCWLAGDMLFTDPAPMAELVAAHLEQERVASFFYCRTDRFKLKLRPGPSPEVVLTREPGYPLSIPNFHVQSPKVFSYMAPDPNGNYLQDLIAAGEPILVREYPAPVFEIDTPEDLAKARRFFGGSFGG
jgi:NDP-sugar pyrophosphorylase family protein